VRTGCDQGTAGWLAHVDARPGDAVAMLSAGLRARERAIRPTGRLPTPERSGIEAGFVSPTVAGAAPA